METIIELKAKAYDIIAQIEYLQKELIKTNEAIAKAVEEEQKQ